MSEYIYGLRQRTGRKPVIKKLGAVRAGIEQTPVVFNGRPIMVESRLGGTDGADVQHIRVNGPDGKKYFAHTLNNTVVAPPRMLIAFLENNLQADGSVRIPEVLRPNMGGKTEIK